jgi:hypothetical protein
LSSKAYHATYYKANLDKIKRRVKAYNRAHPEGQRRRSATYRAAHALQESERKRIYRAAHREECRHYTEAYRKADPERRRRISRCSYLLNRQKKIERGREDKRHRRQTNQLFHLLALATTVNQQQQKTNEIKQ